jgi:hypothetical protein
MKKVYFFLILSCFLWVCSMKKYRHTAKVCDGTLYVESFIINLAGINADYLTDSLHFRFYVDKWDSDHQIISYNCMGDSIWIQKLDPGGPIQEYEKKVYSLHQLKQQKSLHWFGLR